MDSGEGTSQDRPGEMSRLRMRQLQAAERLRREYLRTGEASGVNTVWVSLFQYLLDDVREREAALEDRFEEFRRDDHDYLCKLDIFIETLKNFSDCEADCGEEIKMRQEDIKKDIQDMEKKIKERSELLEKMNHKLKGLKRSREELLKLRETPEFTVLSNWVHATSTKCMELENEITEIKLRIGKKNEDVLEFLGYGHNIFAKLSLEDLKKLPPFTTDAEPSTSFDTSHQ